MTSGYVYSDQCSTPPRCLEDFTCVVWTLSMFFGLCFVFRSVHLQLVFSRLQRICRLPAKTWNKQRKTLTVRAGPSTVGLFICQRMSWQQVG